MFSELCTTTTTSSEGFSYHFQKQPHLLLQHNPKSVIHTTRSSRLVPGHYTLPTSIGNNSQLAQ